MAKTNFNELKCLYLDKNNIININVFLNVNMIHLESLNLSNNKINDISIFEKANFNQLKYLYLNNNNISDINVLDKANFFFLIEMNLANNEISDIGVFVKVNFYQFDHLILTNNKINYCLAKNKDIILNLLFKEYIVDI